MLTFSFLFFFPRSSISSVLADITTPTLLFGSNQPGQKKKETNRICHCIRFKQLPSFITTSDIGHDRSLEGTYLKDPSLINIMDFIFIMLGLRLCYGKLNGESLEYRPRLSKRKSALEDELVFVMCVGRSGCRLFQGEMLK